MRHRGFTLVELVVIIMIIGVIAVFASSRFASQDTFESRGYYDELVSATRFAQRYAVASGCTVRINIAATTYSLTTQDATCGIGTPVQSPSGGNFAATAPTGVSVTAGAASYDFDASGSVNAGGSVTVSGGGTVLTFSITSGSGFVNTP